MAVQAVSEPDASSPAAFVVPAAHAVHAFDDTYSFVAHRTPKVQMCPPRLLGLSIAASMVPSLEEVMPSQP